MLFLYNYSPYSINYDAASKWIAVFIGLLLLTVYWLFFVYRFGRFRIRWEYPKEHVEPAAEGRDAFGDFADSPRCRRKALKSRGAFVLLTLVVAGITAAYCLFGFEMSPMRLYRNHTEALNRLADIADDYEYLYIDEDTNINGFILTDEYINGARVGYKPSEAAAQEIRDIIRSLHTGYIRYIAYDVIAYEDKMLEISLSARWGPHCDLLWYPNAETSETLQHHYRDACYINVRVAQLDPHWWMVWYTYDSNYASTPVSSQ